MTDNKKLEDGQIAAIGAAAIIFSALIYYWFTEVTSTIELLELAYGSFKFFNNPLVF